VLDAAVRKAEVVETVLPQLSARLEALVRRLGETMPAGLPLVPAHGDFHVDQLLVRDEDIAVVDFDGLCLAAPALDLATYAADVVRGRPEDQDKLHAVLEPLLEGYGGRPDALHWHLAAAVLARAAHPFQRQVPGWRERVEATVAVAEAGLD
jgi:Ser/Thr protein kinase RdoA (MazF antagonist)